MPIINNFGAANQPNIKQFRVPRGPRKGGLFFGEGQKGTAGGDRTENVTDNFRHFSDNFRHFYNIPMLCSCDIKAS